MNAKIKILAVVVVGVIVVSVIFMVLTTRDDKLQLRTVVATKQDVIQDVSFTGRLKSKQVSNLSFESTGAIEELLVAAGDSVKEGQPLVKLETRSAQLSTAKSMADRVAAQEQKKIAWNNAEKAWQNTKATNTTTIEKKRQIVRDEKAEFDQYRAIHQIVATEQGVNDSTSAASAANVKLAETAYNSARKALIEAIESDKQTVSTTRQAADLAKAQYQATIQASSAIAGLSSLEATEAIAKYNLTKKTITAPFDGVITKIEKEIGETTTASETVVIVETINQLELKANVTETDAAKIVVDMNATISFDALPVQEKWSATVSYISPAARMIEGVPTYEIILLLTNNDDRFKPGLTANIIVHADSRYNVIAIPRRAVATKKGEQFIRILNENGDVLEQKITTGLAGSIGTIEVTSGLTVGQKVVIDNRKLE